MEWLGLQLFADLPATGRIVIDCRHEPFLVLLAYLVACAACFATLDMAERQSHSEDPTAHRQWNMLGACCLAGGIWAMHFIAMLACNMGVQVTYDVVLTAVSAVLAIAACSLGLAIVSAGSFRLLNLMFAGVLMGLGVAGMHYLGMSAMLTSAQASYDGGVVALSVAIAIVASMAALWLAFDLRGRLQMLGSALVMGVAVCGMHYTGMSALELSAGDTLPAGFAQGLNGDYLGMVIFGVVVLLLALALGLSVVRQQRRAALTI